MTVHRWTSEPMTIAGTAAAAWVAACLTDAPVPPPNGDRVGLYLSTSDGGSREALAFWQSAHRTGLALAAPAAFPWTLANSVTGSVSSALGITGPCTTWVGGPEADAEAELTAMDDLSDGTVDLAVVVTVHGETPPDAAGTPTRLGLTARVLTGADPPGGLPSAGDARSGTTGDQRATR
ncbi:MAG: hypothetical protein WBL35_04495 [Ornithinibacter sp.]